jgi:hypothetical protein
MDSDNKFLGTTLLQWWSTVVLQNLVQIAYAPMGEAAGLAPSFVALTMGISIMVAYLDFKMRTTPESLPAGYYSEGDVAVSDSDEAPKERKPQKKKFRRDEPTLTPKKGVVIYVTL